MGEPLQFYMQGASPMAPYERVLFEVNKTQVTGYLSTPKEGGGAPAATPAAATTKPQS